MTVVSLLKREVEARLKKNKGSMHIKCPYCVPGYRHMLGNCFICGWGPAPGGLEDPIPMDRLVAEYGPVSKPTRN